MKYMLLIYDDEQVWAKLSASEQQRLFGEYMAFTESIKASGNYISGEPLQPIATATSLKIRNDKQLVTDGPFAETQEQLGGYYLVNARDLDEAIGIAARIPSVRLGTDRDPAGDGSRGAGLGAEAGARGAERAGAMGLDCDRRGLRDRRVRRGGDRSTAARRPPRAAGTIATSSRCRSSRS